MLRLLAICTLLAAFMQHMHAEEISFSRQIRPILSENCFFCHGPDEAKRSAGLRLDEEAAAKADREGVIAIVPGDPARSALIQRILSTDPDEVMPPPKQHKTLPPAQIALLQEWIRQGAKWGAHWSYEPVVRPPVPHSGSQEGHAIDAFLTQRLAAEGLTYSPRATPATLIRRVALDLTGLPPTPEELARFSSRLSTGEAGHKAAFMTLVDHYLSHPAYGEHWAAQWLDLARYADSSGYPSDQPREIWAYRDWVIRAFNANMPFDQFTIEQLAGDLLPQPTDDQLIATAFHRNTMTQNEGGTDDEEFRNAAIIDRVNTTFAVWMGTTMACAQCHTHKYDPLTLKEYFQFYAYLNQTADSDKKDEVPLHSFDPPETRLKRAALTQEIATLEARFRQPPPTWLTGLEAWAKSLGQDLTWHSPIPATFTGGDAHIQPDGRIHLEKNAETATHTLELPLTTPQLSALRLETQPRQGFGNFVLTHLKAEILPPTPQAQPHARHIRIELPGEKKMLQLAEVQVFRGQENLAPSGTAKQSSLYADAAAKRANDGNTDGRYASGSVSHTSGTESDPWWELDLKATHPLDRIIVWNRLDGVGQRLEGFRLILLDEKRQIIWQSGPTPAPETAATFHLHEPSHLHFTTALADYSQPGFEAAAFLQPGSKGWAVGGAHQQPHQLTLLTSQPHRISPHSRLRLTLSQHSPYPQHTLGSYRISLSADSRVSQVAQVPPAIITALSTPTRTTAQEQALQEYYARHISPQAAPSRTRLTAAQKALTTLKPITVPIMRELSPEQQRTTKIQLRGNWQAHGEAVTPGTPAIFPAPPPGAPSTRLTMAHWLISPENPLTARVTVNRLWESLFGTGIVRTSEEFGSQGELPLHPELLDWLAAEFIESGWDIRHMLRLMLTTQAYQQDSRSTATLNERDPENRLLARGPRFRPTGELLRDQALAVSGLLSPKMHGPPVRPMMPNLGLSTAFGRSNDWTVSPGEDRHRRSIYTEIRRNSPYASFTTFDASNREVCTIRRNRTNTPLQAFVTLNDPVFIEAHQAMARRLIREAADTPARLTRLFQLTLCRPPTPGEAQTLTQLHRETLTAYRTTPAEATRMATEPLGPTPPGSDIPELATWTALANIVMNLDEFLMRP